MSKAFATAETGIKCSAASEAIDAPSRSRDVNQGSAALGFEADSNLTNTSVCSLCVFMQVKTKMSIARDSLHESWALSHRAVVQKVTFEAMISTIRTDKTT